MQEKSDTFLNFSDRISALTRATGWNMSEISRQIGISRAMLYTYTTGKTPISNKAWLKLEEAERAAGLGDEEMRLRNEAAERAAALVNEEKQIKKDANVRVLNLRRQMLGVETDEEAEEIRSKYEEAQNEITQYGEIIQRIEKMESLLEKIASQMGIQANEPPDKAVSA
jgi:transcriptional regulator with XRE-family HTH domain